jgi:hypothetical protein
MAVEIQNVHYYFYLLNTFTRITAQDYDRLDPFADYVRFSASV